MLQSKHLCGQLRILISYSTIISMKLIIGNLKDLIILIYETIHLLMATLRGVLQSQQFVGKLMKNDGHFMIYQSQKDV